jgi:hypothetical protein
MEGVVSATASLKSCRLFAGHYPLLLVKKLSQNMKRCLVLGTLSILDVGMTGIPSLTLPSSHSN